MEAHSSTRTIFQNISSIDHRYSISEAAVFDALVPWISEEASVGACVRAEIALVVAHLKVRGQLNDSLRKNLEHATEIISPEEVYAEEEKTRHNIRALVNVIKKKVPSEVAPLVHLGATSVDILDTSLSYRMKGVTLAVVLPELKKLEVLLCNFAEKEAETPQVGRTHGQHAVPITVGFAVAEYISRLGKSILEIERLAGNLKGKLAGAVGAYNATSMIVKDPEELERIYLAELGLEPSEHSTQLVEPEYLLRLLLEFNTAFGVIANLADDLRNLQRSEIGELREGFGADQVGSSTMPQKRNPWNSEHVKSLWKAFMPRVMTFFMDQISEHQRDLSNSASQRFIADYVAGFSLAVSRMSGVIEGLGADHERLLANLRGNTGIPGGVLAEPAYILLAESGVSDAHEVIRKITLAAEKEKLSFAQALSRESDVLARIGNKMLELGLISASGEVSKAALAWFEKPEQYCGLAVKKAKTLSAKYRELMETKNV
ncbi:lyase family protein [Leadbettera azotonutricia]|uniref:Putative adenylosuccinate lyase n=1 Tax=Leadbettera azotonutricia (strain ATCC BAA-888 / DSM 13862 / ZAS-9) TaxID=545695 RepID=F5YDY7_LEAAZ|nr:lyase family protein [Leadbettera azotonutricia]AEF80564.1 putative adenylosuccinate lyase [Leadbettera azotonutricia ZAS-9]